MGLMDKVKQQAGQALAKAQEGVNQGQAKLDQVQAKRQADALLRKLGAAYYARERTNGPQDPIDSTMKELDEHVAAHGPLDTAPGATEPATSSTMTSTSSAPSTESATASPSPATMPTAGAPTTAGSFSIDDV